VITPVVLPWPLQSSLETMARVLLEPGDRLLFYRPSPSPGACSRTRSLFSSAASPL